MRDEERSGERGLDVLVWVKATEPDQIITTYAETAERLQLPGSTSDDSGSVAEAFMAWLAATKRRWLVVLDDITDPATADKWWPDGNAHNGRVLATTRRDDAVLSGKGRTPIPLDLYTAEEARAFLHRRLTDAGHPRLYDTDAVDPLIKELGRLPLALGHAAAYMINKRCTTSDYLARFRDTDIGLSNLLPPDADTEGYGRPVATALLISLTAVQAVDATQLARPLLEFISLTAPQGHPAQLWSTPPALQYLRTSRPGHRRWLRRHQPVVTAQQVQDALNCLRTYALVTQDTSDAPIRIHALTARAVRETIPARTKPTIARVMADALQRLWPDLDHQDRELAASLRMNTLHLDEHTFPALWQPDVHACIYQVSDSLTAVGLLDQAVDYDRVAVQQSTELHGPEDPDTLTARSNLAVSYRVAGRRQEAL
ncbi:NB-ARC domain-containing protein, partial [Streptomyces sp. NPDC058287]